MRYKYLANGWQGIVLALISIIATLWLGLHKQLNLYIHPRYITFTLVMATVGLIVIICSFWQGQVPKKILQPRKPLTIISSTLIMLLALTMLVVKPAPLSSFTATKRGINEGSALTKLNQQTTIDVSPSADLSQFSVKELATLMGQGLPNDFFVSKSANLTGFITPADTNPDVFYISRFVITCCAVDARPVGVAVYAPQWQKNYAPNTWLHVEGTFGLNKQSVLLQPSSMTKVSQPGDPYER